MKVEHLGIEWGGAYELAQPIKITHHGREILVYVKEGHDLVVQARGEVTVGQALWPLAEGPCIQVTVRS